MKKLNEMIKLNKSDLIILAGSPGTGKTRLVLNMIMNICQNIPTAFFNMDNVERILYQTSLKWKKDKILFETDCLSLDSICERIRELKQKNNLGFVVIDMNIEEQMIEEITTTLKRLATELNIVILATVLLDRGLDKTLLVKIGQSMASNDNIDIMMLLYRDEYCNENTEEKNVVEIIVTKNRYDKLETVKLKFCGNYGRIKEVD